MKNFRIRKNKSAFTLIELLTVITILAILMGLSMAIISFAQGKAAEDKTRGAMSAIKAGLERYKVRNGEYPEPMENSGSGTSGAIALYQALLDDGDDEIFGGPNNPSDGRAGEEMLVDLLGKGLVGDDESGVWYLKDGYDRPFMYQVYDSENPDATNQSTYDLWSYGTDKERNKTNKTNEPKWVKNW
ncbi:type II secretion system GspH family protein [Verrucomicrobiales bacterium]|nr:type II secretion system GspH family protein [Verrucomicrobiales bacterium]